MESQNGTSESRETVFLGIDLGTSHLKVSAFDPRGRILAAGRAPVPMIRPQPGYSEQDTSGWWQLLCSILRRIERETPDVLARTGVISVCGHSHGPTPYARDRGALGPCITWLDQRGRDEVEWMVSSIGEDAFLAEGNVPLDTCYTAAKLLWIRNHRPTIYRGADVFLLPKDVLVHRLTGVFSTDFTDASVTNLFSSNTFDWSETLLKRCGLDVSKLPPVRRPWDVVGEVTTAASQETGLKPGIPVIAGAADWACLYYGAGGIRPGVLVDLSGTVGGLVVTTEDDAVGFPGMPSLLPGLRNSIAGCLEASSVTYEWFTDGFGPDDAAGHPGSRFALMDGEAADVRPGSEGLLILPRFAGARRPQRENSRGVIFGLTLGTKRAAIARAILEGIAYEARRAVERIIDAGVPVDDIRAIGGGARSELSLRIKADVTGKTYCVLSQAETGTFGAAMLGGYAVGAFCSLEEPIDRLQSVKDRILPRAQHKEIYDALYPVYCHFSDALDTSTLYDELENALRLSVSDSAGLDQRKEPNE